MPKQFFHICNSSIPEMPGYESIISRAELLKVNKFKDAVFIINVHLSWEGNKLSSNYGFDIANELRIKFKVKSPIIFYSPIQVSYFEYKSENEIKYKILFGRGSAFIETPCNEAIITKLIESIEPLSNAVLHDVVTMLCDLKGIVIEKINHDLKFGKDIDVVIAAILPFLSEVQKKLISLDTFVTEIKQIENEKDFNTARQLFVEKCNYELTSEGENKPKVKKKKYKILIVDDVVEELSRAEAYLKDDFKVITASTGKVAIDILLNDIHNEIFAVVSDWRLFTDDKKNYWQPLQGYEVLEVAAKTGIRSLFALTSQANFLIHQLRNLMGLNFPLFQKQNLIAEGQWKVFADALMEACETTDELINSQPTSDHWDSSIRKKKDLGISLKVIYAIKRHTKDIFFTEINDRADEIWQTYLDNKKIRYLLGELSTTEISEDVLKEVLVQRRIWIGAFLNSTNADDIYDLMSKDPQKVATKSDITQLKIKLCIKENDIKQKRFLPEEKAWFKKWKLMD